MRWFNYFALALFFVILSSFSPVFGGKAEDRGLLRYIEKHYTSIDQFKDEVCNNRVRRTLKKAWIYKNARNEPNMERALTAFMLKKANGEFSRTSDKYQAIQSHARTLFEYVYSTDGGVDYVVSLGVALCFEEGRTLPPNAKTLVQGARRAKKKQAQMADVQ